MKSCLLLVIALAASISVPAAADESYPNKPVQIIVGYPPGGATDITARLLAKELTETNKQPFLVVNKAGVGGMLGMNQVAKAAPDGYTLGMAVSGVLATGPHLVRHMLYDPMTAFEPIILTNKAPMLLIVSPDANFNTVGSMIKEAKARPPGELMFGSGSQAAELTMQLINAKAGVKLGLVPYPGGVQAAIDVIAGRVPIMVDSVAAQQVNIKAGKLKAIAVLDSSRSAVLPDVPTVAEAGFPGYEAVGWNGVVAPKGTPEAIIKKLNDQLRQIMAKTEVRERLINLGFEPTSSSPKEFDRFIQADYVKWGAVVKEAGMVAQ